MEICINYGINCVSCYHGCIDVRRCTGNCGNCIDSGCDNHPQITVKSSSSFDIDELHEF